MRKIFLALSPAIFGLGLYACAGSPTSPSGMNDLSSSAPARTESTVGTIRQFDNPVDADAVEIGPDGQSVSKKDKGKNQKNTDKDDKGNSKDDSDKSDKNKNDNDNKSDNGKNTSADQANENGGENAGQNSNNSVGSRSPVLDARERSVGPGDNVTVTLTNGSGGANQWIALASVNAPDSNYVLSIQVGPGVTARTWTVRMPMTAGPYQFRLFVNGNRGYSVRGGAHNEDGGVPKAPPAQNTRAATSPTVMVGSRTTPPVIVNDPTSTEGNDLPVVVDEQPAPPPIVVEPPVSQPPVVVQPPPPPPVVEPAPSTDPAISVSSQTVTGGTSMSATLTNGLLDPYDWLTYAPVGSPDSEYWDWTYVPGGFATYTWTFTVPAIAGTYEIRLLLHGGNTKVATSPSITVK
jgi:hypothetical protein